MRDRLLDIYKRLEALFGPQHWWPGDTPFEVAVGAVLTQNTNWGNVERAIKNLKHARALSARAIHSMGHDELAALIRPAGYFNVKSVRLKNFVGFLMDSYGGSLKRMSRTGRQGARAELLGVNGIGPETADSIVLYALGQPVFVIDAYTKRALSRHGLMDAEVGYEQWRSMFEDNLDQDTDMFNEYHALLVALGKDYCRPRNPRCDGCPLEGV